MGTRFVDVSPERAAELDRIMRESMRPGQALVTNRETGQVVGVARVDNVTPDPRVGVISKFGRFGRTS